MKFFVFSLALLILISFADGQVDVDLGQWRAARFVARELGGRLLSLVSWRGIRWIPAAGHYMYYAMRIHKTSIFAERDVCDVDVYWEGPMMYLQESRCYI